MIKKDPKNTKKIKINNINKYIKTSKEKEKKLVLALSKLKNLNYENPALINDLQNLDDQKNQLEIEKKEIETKYGNLIQDYEALKEKLNKINKNK